MAFCPILCPNPSTFLVGEQTNRSFGVDTSRKSLFLLYSRPDSIFYNKKAATVRPCIRLAPTDFNCARVGGRAQDVSIVSRKESAGSTAIDVAMRGGNVGGYECLSHWEQMSDFHRNLVLRFGWHYCASPPSFRQSFVFLFVSLVVLVFVIILAG